MTEADWLTEIDLTGMQEHVKPRATPRQWRLFACGCIRELGYLLTVRRARDAFFVAERFADGRATLTELARAHGEAVAAHQSLFGPNSDRDAYGAEVFGRVSCVHSALVALTRKEEGAFVASLAGQALLLRDYIDSTWAKRINRLQCDLLRDLFGNPFRPARLPKAWVRAAGRDAISIARGIYEDRSFDELPILADALFDANCPSEEMIRHCQEPGVHGRGCWVIDALMRFT